MSQEVIQLFKCLSDKSRLAIITNLMKEPMYVELLSKRLNLAPSTISFHLKKLEKANIVKSKKDQYYVVYSLNKTLLTKNVLEIISEFDTEVSQQKEREDKYTQSVLTAFFKYGKLISIPVQHKKRKIILEKIAQSFEPSREYTEKEVNLIIADFHDDFCTLRRELIAFKIMERDHGIYKLL